ncbi:hypothetical protein FOCC_FOCC017925 [Frankliniella occidentalis]|nr:hypothetical protein FOCC_FOCC017925 [Frankliniella occidentalis]
MCDVNGVTPDMAVNEVDNFQQRLIMENTRTMTMTPAPAQRQTQVMKRRLYLTLDNVKAQMNLSAESRMSDLSAQTAPQVPWQCVAQMQHPAINRSSAEVLSKALTEAAVSAAAAASQTIEQAVKEAADAILAPETFGLVQQVVQQTASMSRTEAVENFAKMVGPNERPAAPLQGNIELALDKVLLESYQSAVSTLSHYLLVQAVELALQNSILPNMQARVVSTLSDHVLNLMQSEEMKPAIPPVTRQHTQNAAKAAAAETVQKCMAQAVARSGPPLRVLAVGPPVTAAAVQQVPKQAVYPPAQQRPPAYKQIASQAPAPAPASTGDSAVSAHCAAPASPVAPRRTSILCKTPTSNRTKTVTQISPGVAQVIYGIPPGNLTPATTPEDSDGHVKASLFLPNGETGAWETLSLSLPAPRGGPVVNGSGPPPESPKRVKQQHKPAASTASKPAATIAALPDEVLCEVLRNLEPLVRLTTCKLVCRRWREVCSGELMWGREVLRYEARQNAKFSRVLRLAPQLAMVDCERMSRKQGRRSVAQRPPRHVTEALVETSCCVRGLRLSTMDLDPEYCLSVLEKHSPHLEELDLIADADVVDVSTPDTPCKVLDTVDRMPALKKLRLSGFFPEVDLSAYYAPGSGTVCSLLTAYQATLVRVVLQQVGVAELIHASLCPNLLDLTVPCEVLARHAPASLPSVFRLTLTRRPAVLPDSASAEAQAAIKMDLHRSFMLPILGELVLDGVSSPASIPKMVRATFKDLLELTFRATNMSSTAMLGLLKDMPSLERLVFDREFHLSDNVLTSMTGLGLKLKSIHIIKSLSCSKGVCCGPTKKFLTHCWPKADVYVDLKCVCPQ